MREKVVRDGIYPERRTIANESDVQTGAVPAYGSRMAAEQDVEVAARQLTELALREMERLSPEIVDVVQLDPDDPDRVQVGRPNLVGKPGREVVFGYRETRWVKDRKLAHEKRRHDDLKRLAAIAEQLRQELEGDGLDPNEARWLSFQMGLAARKAFEGRHAELDALLGRDQRARAEAGAKGAARKKREERRRLDRQDAPQYQARVEALCLTGVGYTEACELTAQEFRIKPGDRHHKRRVTQLTRKPAAKKQKKLP